MAWANVSNVVTTNLDSATDNPSLARGDLYNALVELQAVINGRGTALGVAGLDANSKISSTVLPSTLTTTTGNLVLAPQNSRVTVQDVVNLAPVDYSSLPATPARGDVAYLTEDGAAASQEQIIYYNGSDWKYMANLATVAAS